MLIESVAVGKHKVGLSGVVRGCCCLSLSLLPSEKREDVLKCLQATCDVLMFFSKLPSSSGALQVVLRDCVRGSFPSRAFPPSLASYLSNYVA